MALCGPWGVFLHIPKTGGSWVRRCLRDNLGSGHESGKPHGWPHYNERHQSKGSLLPAQKYLHGTHFTFVRHPATWLRSFWAHSGVAKWNKQDKGDTNWGQLCAITAPCASEDLDEFLESVAVNLPGLVSWFMGLYCIPRVVVGCMEDYPHSLKKVAGMMCTMPPVNKPAKPHPGLKPELIKLVEEAEPWLMNKYYTNRDHVPQEVAWDLEFEKSDHGATGPAFVQGV